MVFYQNYFVFDLEYYNEEQKLNKINFINYNGMYHANAGKCTDGADIFSPYNKYLYKINIDYNKSFYYKGNLGITFWTRNYLASFIIFTKFFNPFFVKAEYFLLFSWKQLLFYRFSFGYNFVLKTNLNNFEIDHKPIFYTDTNALEVIKRTINKY